LWSFDQAEHYQRLASYADEILKGTHPASLPAEQPTTFEAILNARTAKVRSRGPVAAPTPRGSGD
jgi:ABC-type uncharacterized transport system substrate-binding protein